MKLGSIFGVSVQVSPYFLLLMLAYIGFGIWLQAVAFFVLVFIHEWTHILVAKGYGIEVSSVELLPFGGVARFAGGLEVDPRIESLVALAGPASNLLLIPVGVLLGRSGWLPQAAIDFFITANLLVAVFNLVPALPLDGGRVLRAWLSTKVGFRRATTQAAWVGKICGALMAFLGIITMGLQYTDFTFAVVGVFVCLAAHKEARQAQFVFLRYLQRKKEDLIESGILRSSTLVVQPDYPVKKVIKQFLPQRFAIIHIVDNNFRVTRTLSETQIINALFERGIDFPVGEIDRGT
ncbi:MAG TPA: M50 family metallopeptidase [Desulfobacteria bacterium]|nr:M50 family metallopeptidase [Desulfobacteria bacterium]